jgi:hypothetical protein
VAARLARRRVRGFALKSALEVRCRAIALRSSSRRRKMLSLAVHKSVPAVRIRLAPPSSPSLPAIQRQMIEIRAWAADFAQLVAAENAPNRGLGRFSARFIRRNQIRGHDENGPHHLEFVDRPTSPTPHCRASGVVLVYDRRGRHRWTRTGHNVSPRVAGPIRDLLLPIGSG